jgi:hypothetical protein
MIPATIVAILLKKRSHSVTIVINPPGLTPAYYQERLSTPCTIAVNNLSVSKAFPKSF